MERIHQLIKRSDHPPESVIQLLEHTLIGTEGSRYQLMDTRTKIHQLHEPHFLFIERNDKAIGNITICDRRITLNTDHFDALYIRYFAFDQIFQGGSQKGKANSAFHQYFKFLFETSNMDPIAPEKDRSMYWAYIDPENLRSFNMNERFDFQAIGTFRTRAFSRSHPKSSAAVRTLRTEEQGTVLKLISDFYDDFNFFSDIHLFENDNFFVLEDKGDIVAGIQANPSRFSIKSLSGFGGKILVKAAPMIPVMRKLINPKEHRFLATEGLFWKAGHENKISELLEGVLAQTKHHSLLLWIDDENEMLNNLNIKWGPIEKVKSNNPVQIVAKFNGFSSQEVKAITHGKKYLSGFDMT